MTPSSGGGTLRREERRALEARQRALVARQALVPYLLEVLGPKSSERDEVPGAALIALAKLTTDEGARDVIYAHACDERHSAFVRESAALALGLLRRSDEAARMGATATDVVRRRLLRLADDETAPWRTRAFAVYGLGVLADQPYGSVFGEAGEKLSVDLMRRLEDRNLSSELRTAIFTTLGLQPEGSVPQPVLDDLRKIASGRRTYRIKWSEDERSHALTALVHLRAPAWDVMTFRALGNGKSSVAIRRAAFLALSGNATDLSATTRLAAAQAIQAGLNKSHDGLTEGLGLIALGRVLGADLAEDSAAVLAAGSGADHLLNAVRGGVATRRGYGALALGFAAAGVAPAKGDAAGRFRKRALDALLDGLKARKGDEILQASLAVGLGLLGDESAVDPLCDTVENRKAGAYVRSQAAVALAQIGTRSVRALKVLYSALGEEGADVLRSEAALALSLYGGEGRTKMLVSALAHRSSQRVVGRIATALGHLGDPDAAPDLLGIARAGGRAANVRAQAVAALGLLCDPEPRPSLQRVAMDANYPTSSNALYELLDVL